MCSFNQPGHICHNKGTKVTQVNYAQVWFQCGERVVCDLGPGCGNGGDEGRLAGVRKSHQTDVGKQFELQLQLKFFTLTATLVIAWRAIR
jgi:hypothetical protein